MVVTLTRIIKYGLQAFVRNGWLSVSTISIMILAAIVFEGLVLFNVMGKTAIVSLQEKIDISVYFKSNAAEDYVLSVKKSLENLSEVRNVEYVSSEAALAEFKKRHENDAALGQAIDELDRNPLLASLNIKAKDPSQYKVIADYLETKTLKDQIEKVTYAQNQVVIDRLVAFIDSLRKGGIALTVFLSLLAVVVTFNTIRLAIFSASEQINIMRLVGASNAFIRGPFIVEGIIYGFISTIISFFIVLPLVSVISPSIHSFIAEIDLSVYVNTNIASIFLYQLLFCVGMGIVSSYIAVRRYLYV